MKRTNYKKEADKYEGAAIAISFAVSLIRNKLVGFHHDYTKLKKRKGSDKEVRKLVEENFRDWKETLNATDGLKKDVDKIMRGKRL